MTEVPQIQFIDESRRQRGQETQRDVYTQVREQGGVCPQAKLWDKHQENRVISKMIKPFVRASDGERDRVKSYMSEAWRGSAHQNSSAAVYEAQLEHREHDDSQR